MYKNIVTHHTMYQLHLYIKYDSKLHGGEVLVLIICYCSKSCMSALTP